MTELASPGQLRAAFLRWALFVVPGILFLGFFSGALANSGPGNPWFFDLVRYDDLNHAPDLRAHIARVGQVLARRDDHLMPM